MMFTKNDLKYKSVFLLDCTQHNKSLKLKNGEFYLEQDGVGLTKFPFSKILAVIIVGDATLTTPFIDKCSYWGVTLISTKKNLRPVFFNGNIAEANYLLRFNQYFLNEDNRYLSYAKKIVQSKIENSLKTISLLRGDLENRNKILESIKSELEKLNIGNLTLQELLGIEGRVAKNYFSYMFKDFGWKNRLPKVKIDFVNVLLDIGYTLLFNFLECFIRLFGFDCYVGIYHRLWYRRKSLVCDLMEPFRCIVDKLVRKNIKLKIFKEDDFEKNKDQYVLPFGKAGFYYAEFVSCIVEYKNEIFSTVLSFYKAVMSKDPNKMQLFNYQGAKR